MYRLFCLLLTCEQASEAQESNIGPQRIFLFNRNFETRNSEFLNLPELPDLVQRSKIKVTSFLFVLKPKSKVCTWLVTCAIRSTAWTYFNARLVRYVSVSRRFWETQTQFIASFCTFEFVRLQSLNITESYKPFKPSVSNKSQLVVKRVLTLRRFWDLEKTALRKIRVSGIVGVPY